MRGRPSTLRACRVTAFLSAGAALPVVTFAVACGTASTPPSLGTSSTPTLTLSPTLVLPKGVVGVTNYRLQVYTGSLDDGGVGCNAATGALTGSAASAKPVIDVSDSTGAQCGGGDARCFVGVKVTQSFTPSIFYVTGYSKVPQTTQNLLAQGCVSEVLRPMDAASTASFTITMQPSGASCGDNIIESPETCDPPAPGVCSSACQTEEVPLSTGSKASLTMTGAAGDKSDPSFVWPPAGSFYGVFGDSSSGTSHLAFHALSTTLADVPFYGPTSLYLPSAQGQLPQAAPPGAQSQPVAVESNNFIYVVYTSKGAGDGGGTSTIALRSYDNVMMQPQQPAPCPVSETLADAGVTGNMSAPAVTVSASGSVLYIAWQDDSGNLYGRTYTPGAAGACGTLGTQYVVSNPLLTNNSQVAVTPSRTSSGSEGWVAAWKSGTDVVVRSISFGGVPSSDKTGAPLITSLETAGHSASAPSITTIVGSDVSAANLGAFAIAWLDTSGGATTVYAQRYSNGGMSIDASGGVQISASGDPPATAPFIAPSLAVTGSYIVTWADSPSASQAQVRARLLKGGGDCLASSCSLTNAGAGGGFLQNPVDATTNEFVVSVTPGRPRVNPTAVAGGGILGSGGSAEVGPFMAFGWVDNGSGSTYGVVARRFPLPYQ